MDFSQSTVPKRQNHPSRQGTSDKSGLVVPPLSLFLSVERNRHNHIDIFPEIFLSFDAFTGIHRQIAGERSTAVKFQKEDDILQPAPIGSAGPVKRKRRSCLSAGAAKKRPCGREMKPSAAGAEGKRPNLKAAQAFPTNNPLPVKNEKITAQTTEGGEKNKFRSLQKCGHLSFFSTARPPAFAGIRCRGASMEERSASSWLFPCRILRRHRSGLQPYGSALHRSIKAVLSP